MTRFSHCHPCVRLSGRWDTREENYAVSTTPGAYIEIAFRGNMAVLVFDVETNEQPYPHLWISVDGGAKVEAPLDTYLRICAQGKPEENHVAKIIYKGGVERHHRWYQPLVGKITFVGADLEQPGELPEDRRKTIEFVGDSITEGVLIDAGYSAYQENQHNRVYMDDACATYAWLTAEALGLRPIVMGYGAVGVTKSGQGAVPKAAKAYPYCYDGCPISHPSADFILINHGANDSRSPVEQYLEEYEGLLEVIREKNPSSQLIVLSAFCGVYPSQLEKMVEDYNQRHDDHVFFINSTGWIPKEPLHPLRDGHQIVAARLTEILRGKFGL